jgi:hypothetical protein
MPEQPQQEFKATQSKSNRSKATQSKSKQSEAKRSKAKQSEANRSEAIDYSNSVMVEPQHNR